MANRFALRIADFLCRNNTIQHEDKEIYVYGFEILFSNIVNFILIMVMGLLLKQFHHALLFYIVFVVTRSYCGGYHASTYMKCNITFVGTFIVTVIASNMIYPTISFVYLIVFLAIYVGCVLEYAPIDNVHKRLTEEEKGRYRKISILISVFWTVTVFVLYFLSKHYATTLTLTLVMIAMLMLIEVNKKKESY
ncbi:accessory gene regulator [Anaerocolumna cellulosilytica]|uniref:Accessory gene regulator n=1 Tax=Anaerocolumna cellulosilytica TaxID=433286 RepID=A0A6S6QX17_9FIRM|nr:accessory gene regulator B family protein [Anaerocolumna cellulosilytica]MBB5196223.1 accessory gene regulator B [Anaerocolumna cellulosilytica]BCJ92457.1 accessory gene regulator [Anaerocolumna cellulosilytica]